VLVLVLGIHRSGTSLLTAGLQAIGCQLGPFNDLRDTHNPKGYFEHPEARALNERLLKLLGVSWDNWAFHAATHPADPAMLEEWYAEAERFLTTLTAAGQPVALKDPRVGSLLPFWNRVIDSMGLPCRRILLVRDPDEVAESQRQRVLRSPEGFPAIADHEPMHALWAVTMHSILSSLTEPGVLIVRHRHLYEDPRATLAACADFLDIEPDQNLVGRFADTFLDRSLYRARPADMAEGGWRSLATRLYGALASDRESGRLSSVEARKIADDQSELRAQLPQLRAARETISRLKSEVEASHAQYRKRVSGLTRMIWTLGPTVLAAPATSLEKLGREIDEVMTEHNTELVITTVAAQLAVRRKDFEKAETLLRGMEQRFPEHPLTYRMMIQLFNARNQLEEARRVREKAAKLFPQSPYFAPIEGDQPTS
jgi:hypothetical protein